MELKLKNVELLRTIKDSSLEDLSFMSNVIQTESIKKVEWINQLNTRNTAITEELFELGEVKKLLIKLKNSKMIDKKDFILNTINIALGDVFLDQEVKIDLVASNTNQESSKLNIKYDIVLYQNGVEMARNEKLLSKNGGGVLSFISILFKILVGYIYSKNKFYVFDESLSEVSEVYLPRMGQFLQKFCEKHKFTIILITHTPVVAEYADIVYKLDGEFEEGIPTLKIEKVEGGYPTENYIYTKIENFQSIKKLEFRYKGFTAIIGKNNIGKSASFRAINSIIFNNFDMKEFPRMASAEKPDKLLPTKIEFGFYHNKDNPLNDETKILMYKKGASLIYEFNNQTFVGKNLAFDKVKEKIESIGFKYLKLKEQYKNFKGNLKDQTERLAITTQQDTYYLIGGKATDTSKVFDFLFDSREVTMALIELNNDILKLEQELNTNTLTISEENKNIIFNNHKSKLISCVYKIKLIEKLISLNHDVDEISSMKYKTEKNLNLIIKILNIATTIYTLNNNGIIKNFVQIAHEKVIKKIKVIDILIENLQKQAILERLNDLNKNIKKINLKIKFLNNNIHINFIRTRIAIDNIIKVLKTKELRLHKFINIYNKLIINLQCYGFLENYINTYDKKQIIEKRMLFLNKKINTITAYITNINNRFAINNTIENLNNLKYYINTLNKFKTIQCKQIVLIDKKIEVEKIKFMGNQIITYKNSIIKISGDIDIIKNRIKNLHDEYNLKPCSQCVGLGFHIH